MLLAVRKQLTDNISIWGGIMTFTNVVNLLIAKIILIQQTETKQTRSTKGITGGKKTKKQELIEKTIEGSSALQSFASDNGNQDLYSLVDFSEAELETLPDAIVKDRAQLVLDTVNANAASLAGEGFDAADIIQLQTLVNEYDVAIPAPITAISNKKTATETLKTLFSETMELLETNLDKKMVQFKQSHPEFFSDYENNREILDLGTQHTRLGGVVTDSEGNPLAGVLVRAEEADLEEVTDAGGEYLFKPFIPGDFTITVEKAGFVTKTIAEVHVSPGQHLELDVTLEREVVIVTINGMQVLNIFGPSNPRWVIGATVKIKNITQGPSIGGGHFYPADNAVESWNGSGAPILPGQEVIHTVTSAEFKAFMNGFVQGPNALLLFIFNLVQRIHHLQQGLTHRFQRFWVNVFNIIVVGVPHGSEVIFGGGVVVDDIYGRNFG
jgi:hypothetical protein